MIKILELIAIAAFLAGLGGMLFIFFKKAPLLASLPKVTLVFENKESKLRLFWQELAQKIKNLPFLKNFSFEILLQKILSKVRVFTLRIENRISGWLESLRAKAKKNNTDKVKDDKYWEKLEEKKK